jgi:hypothetical protein
MNTDPRKSEDASAAALVTMREPPGRLGDIVRRLKQATSLPPQAIHVMASTSDAREK